MLLIALNGSACGLVSGATGTVPLHRTAAILLISLAKVETSSSSQPITSFLLSSLARAARETLAHHVAAIPEVFRDADPAIAQAYFEDLLHDQNACVIVAEEGGKIVGYAIMRLRHAELPIQVPRTVALIEKFGVLAAYRRRRVGRLVFERCAQWARQRGTQSLELDCWEANQEGMLLRGARHADSAAAPRHRPVGGATQLATASKIARAAPSSYGARS